MEVASVKNKSKQNEKYSLNLSLLEEKVISLIDLVKVLKDESASLKNKNKELQQQLKSLEGSLVLETKDLEELSQEKMIAKMVVDNLLHSIDAFIETKEKQ